MSNPLMTSRLVHSIHLLAMPARELVQFIANAVAYTPALRIEGCSLCPTCHIPLDDEWCPSCEEIAEDLSITALTLQGGTEPLADVIWAPDDDEPDLGILTYLDLEVDPDALPEEAERAQQLIEGLAQRERTLKQIATTIMLHTHQPRARQPDRISVQTVAILTWLHEATVSRTVMGKSCWLTDEHKLIPLASLLTSS